MYNNAVAILVAAFVFVAAIISCRAQYSFVRGLIPESIIPITEARPAFRHTEESRAREQALQHARQEFDRLDQRIEAMYLDKIAGRISAGFYDEKAAVWRQDQSKLKKRIGELRTASQNFESAIRSIEEISNVCEAFATQPATEQRPPIWTVRLRNPD
jgi:hypothetical protein